MYTMINLAGDQTSDHRMQSQNSTPASPVHIAYKQSQINKW